MLFLSSEEQEELQCETRKQTPFVSLCCWSFLGRPVESLWAGLRGTRASGIWPSPGQFTWRRRTQLQDQEGNVPDLCAALPGEVFFHLLTRWLQAGWEALHNKTLWQQEGSFYCLFSDNLAGSVVLASEGILECTLHLEQKYSPAHLSLKTFRFQRPTWKGAAMANLKFLKQQMISDSCKLSIGLYPWKQQDPTKAWSYRVDFEDGFCLYSITKEYHCE